MKKYIKEKHPKLYSFITNIINDSNIRNKKSFSQFGEDVVLSNFFDPKLKNGFYVDIGAYHPYKSSNTYYYYKMGWKGINIDAKPGSMLIFNKKRKRDINLEIGISNNTKINKFFIFNESAFNTFSESVAQNYVNNGEKLDKIIEIETKRLGEVLDIYLPKKTSIDFLSIDAEGVDIDVLKSNYWDKYNPKYILVEMHDPNIDNIKDSEIYSYLRSKKYKLISIVYITLIFKYEQ